MKLTNNELKHIKAGAMSASIINSLVRGFNSFMDIGRYLGGGVRRLFTGNICPLK